MGIEPTLAAWEAAVLPLNYTRMNALILFTSQCVRQIPFEVLLKVHFTATLAGNPCVISA
jgi:hypothetical protein